MPHWHRNPNTFDGKGTDPGDCAHSDMSSRWRILERVGANSCRCTEIAWSLSLRINKSARRTRAYAQCAHVPVRVCFCVVVRVKNTPAGFRIYAFLCLKRGRAIRGGEDRRVNTCVLYEIDVVSVVARRVRTPPAESFLRGRGSGARWSRCFSAHVYVCACMRERLWLCVYVCPCDEGAYVVSAFFGVSCFDEPNCDTKGR